MIAKALDNLPPYDVGAEMSTLGSLCFCGEDSARFRAIRRHVWRDAFFQSDNQLIFTVLCAMHDKSVPIDARTLNAELHTRGLLKEIGGAEYLGQILNAVHSPLHGEQYAKIVAERARERDACKVITDLYAKLVEPHRDGSAADVLQAEIAKLWQIATSGREISIWRMSDAVDRFVQSRLSGERSISLDSGIEELDRHYRGVFTFGGYTLVAARPSMGKSTFVRWLLDRLASAGTPVGLIAIEENEDKIAGNILSARTGIENSTLAYGRWDQPGVIAAEATALRSVPYFGTDSALNIVDVLTAADVMITQYGCKVIAVDHVHLIDSPRERGETRVNQVTEISKALKNLFKQRKVVGIVAAQLNRPEKSVCPAPPALSDLRDCGGLEEHADGVLMIHRKDYYFRGHDNYTPDGLAQFLIRKNRNGAVGEIVLKAELQFQRFAERVTGHEFD